MKKILALNLVLIMVVASSCGAKNKNEEEIDFNNARILTDKEYDEWVAQNPGEYIPTSGTSGLLCSFEGEDYAQIDVITVSGKMDIYVYDENENIVYEKKEVQTGSFTIKSEDIKNYPSPKNSYKVEITRDMHKGEYNFENITSW